MDKYRYKAEQNKLSDFKKASTLCAKTKEPVKCKLLMGKKIRAQVKKLDRLKVSIGKRKDLGGGGWR